MSEPSQEALEAARKILNLGMGLTLEANAETIQNIVNKAVADERERLLPLAVAGAKRVFYLDGFKDEHLSGVPDEELLRLAATRKEQQAKMSERLAAIRARGGAR